MFIFKKTYILKYTNLGGQTGCNEQTQDQAQETGAQKLRQPAQLRPEQGRTSSRKTSG